MRDAQPFHKTVCDAQPFQQGWVALDTRPSTLIPTSIHHGYDSSPGHWSRLPNSLRKGSNSLWEIVFMMHTCPDELRGRLAKVALSVNLTKLPLLGVGLGRNLSI